MNPLHDIFTQLNASSQAILDEIELKEPSLEVIKTHLYKREELINLLSAFEKSKVKKSLSKTENNILRSLYDEFLQLNESIQKKLSKLLSLHKEKLDTVVNERKIEKKYQIIKNPDISYFLKIDE